MGQPIAGNGDAGRGTVRRREPLQPARGYVMRVKLSVEERDQIRAGAVQAGMALAGFTARAALDAAVAGVVPVGARSALERLAGLQVELAAVRRQLNLLRVQMRAGAGDPAVGPVAETLRRCEEVAEQITRLSGMIHRQLGGG